jgi:recombination protein RecA
MARKSKKGSSDRAAIIADLIANAEKTIGKGSLATLKGPHALNVSSKGVISTGSIGLNHILGVGGLPRGRVVEVYGPEAGGKTTLALHVIAECQKAGGIAAFIDVENGLTPNYAEDLGVDLTELMLSQPSSGEQVFELIAQLLESREVDLIVIDSVAAMTSQAELDGDMESLQPGQQAKLMSKGMRKMNNSMVGSDTVVLFINQIRYKIGGYGNPETTSGGAALRFYTSVRLDIRRIGSIKKGTDVVGNRVKVKVVKNKMAPPFRVAEFDLIFGQGISWEAEFLDYGVACGAIEKKGAWYSYDGSRLGQGRDSVISALGESSEMRKAVEAQIVEYLNA